MSNFLVAHCQLLILQETAREATWDQEGAAYVAFDDAIGQAQVVYDNAVGTCREQAKSSAGTTNSTQ